MLTLPQIIRRVNKRRHESAKYVKIVHQKRGWDSLGRGFVASASYSTHVWDHYRQKFVKNKTGKGGRPNRYVTVIVFMDTYLHAIVSCSCADFKYRWEVALNHQQAADIEYSNGELPVIRNPQMRPAQCKHLVALYNKIKAELPRPKPPKKGQVPIGVPEVQTPPSEIKKRQEEEERKRKEALIKPVKITTPKNVQRSVKPGKKQSTAPRVKVTPPAAMKAPKAPAPKPVAVKAPPLAMMTPKSVSKPTPAKPTPLPAMRPARTTTTAPARSGRANRGPASKGR
jgi:hypothetical protein